MGTIDSSQAGRPKTLPGDPLSGQQAERVFAELAAAFLQHATKNSPEDSSGNPANSSGQPLNLPSDALAQSGSMNPDSMYRALVEQLPAVIFITYLDQRTSEAYVSPQIEQALGFSQEEWLGDPIRWYEHIHPEDKDRWSNEAAELIQGKPLKSVYRVFARDGRVLWFHCEAKIVKREDGRPWFFLGVGFDVTELKETEEALRERTEDLRSLSAKLVQLQDHERRRIARELHDGLGQYLTALKINFDRLADRARDDVGVWTESREILAQCISETRTISYLLHPPMLDDVGLVSAAEWYVDGFAKRSGIRANLNISPEFGRLPKAIELGIFRVLQESLTNVHRHSGSEVVEINFLNSGSEILVEVKDSGRGVDPGLLKKFQATGLQAGVGLAGMRQRIDELGGRFEIVSSQKGTMVKVTFPHTKDARAETDFPAAQG